jgi:hypothetical protein
VGSARADPTNPDQIRVLSNTRHRHAVSVYGYWRARQGAAAEPDRLVVFRGVAPMRKLLLSIATMLFMAGLVVAAEVTLVKYDKDKKELTVKDENDKEKTYKITDKTTFTLVTKDGDKEGKFENVEKLLNNEKFIGSGKIKWDITTDGDKITGVKYKFGGKKKDKNQ